MKKTKFRKVDTELKYGLSYEFSLVLFAIMILAIINIAIEINGIIKPYTPSLRLKSILNILISLGTVYYATVEYKKPHGNLLKYLMLLFAVSILIKTTFTESKPATIAINIINMAIIAYMSGRLDRFRKNTYLALFVAALFFAKGLITITSKNTITFTKFIGSFEALIIWETIVASYITRYKVHIEAGQNLKNKTKKDD